jgi:hypothetical protein
MVPGYIETPLLSMGQCLLKEEQGGKVMTKRRVVLFVTFVLAIGWTMFPPRASQSSADEKGVPVILQSFASKELRAGDVWRVYLKASDPEGKMRYIFATVSQPGANAYPVSIIRIKGENQKELSGYIYLNTLPATQVNFFNLTLSLSVSIKGTGGFSQAAVFPLSFEARATPEAPPDGVFKEQNLGPIMVNLQTVSGGSGDIR